MSLYYQDEHVTLYCGDSLEILPTLDIQADSLLTDPPYFKVKNEPWDNQWKKPDEFLKWIGSFLDTTKPLLEPHASIWVFASPQLATDIEITVRERFRVLNNIRWTKGGNTAHRRADFKTYRSFASQWEAIIFAEQHGDAAKALRGEVFEPLRKYLDDLRLEAGMTPGEVDAAWQATRGSKGAMSPHWFGRSQWRMPTREVYNWIVSALGADAREYEDIRQEYEDLRRKYEELRRPFTPATRKLASDIWDFAPVKPYPGKHPCEKPAPLLRHMIETSTRPGALILDPFAGSGSTLITAKALGRKAIGVEMNEQYCEQIVKTLTTQPEQLTFEFTA